MPKMLGYAALTQPTFSLATKFGLVARGKWWAKAKRCPPYLIFFLVFLVFSFPRSSVGMGWGEPTRARRNQHE